MIKIEYENLQGKILGTVAWVAIISALISVIIKCWEFILR